jgi:hypothetical protein
MHRGSPSARGARGYRVNRTGTAYTFAHDRWLARVAVACLGLIAVITSAVVASPAGPDIGVLAKTGVIGIIVVLITPLYFGIARTGVRVSAGRVSIRTWRTRTVDIEEIRDITLETRSNGQNSFWVPRMRLANGDDIWLTGLSCGSAFRPPVSWRLASLDKFQSLTGVGQVPAQANNAPYPGADAFVGESPVAASSTPDGADATGDGPPTWTKGRQVSPAARFYRDPGGRAGVRYWGGGEWSPLFPTDFAKGQAPAFPGTVVAPLPAPDGTWRYAASQARKARNQSAAFTAGAIIVLILIIGHVVSSNQFPYLGLVLALRALSTWRAWRHWTRLDRTARAEPNFGSAVI